jgi:hypothetical protein
MFEYEYPLFVLVEEVRTNQQQDMLELHNVVAMSDPAYPSAAAVFTDHDAAEQFRDEHAPRHHIFPMPSGVEFSVVLHALRPNFSLIAFDPYRPGKQAQTAVIDDVIRSLGSQGPGRAGHDVGMN